MGFTLVTLCRDAINLEAAATTETHGTVVLREIFPFEAQGKRVAQNDRTRK